MPDRHMWSADVAALSVDGWQLNEDAVVMRSQSLVTNVSPDTVAIPIPDTDTDT